MLKKKLCCFVAMSIMFFCGGDVSSLDSDLISNDDNNYMSSTFYYSIREGLYYLNNIKMNSSGYKSISSYIESQFDVDLSSYQESIFNDGIPLMINNYTSYIKSYESGNYDGCFFAVKSIMDDSIKFSSVVDLLSLRVCSDYANTFNYDYDTIYINDVTLKSLYPARSGLFSIVNGMVDLYYYNISYEYSNYVYWSFYFKNFGKIFDSHVFSFDYDGGFYYVSYFSDLVDIRDEVLSCYKTYRYVPYHNSFIVSLEDSVYMSISLNSLEGQELYKAYLIDCYLKGSVSASSVYELLFDDSLYKKR